MLIGAYAYAIFSIPAEQHASVYQYFDGGAIQFSIPQIISNALGDNAGSFLGSIICILIAGAVAAIFAALIGIPVLRLKSDYLAIATLGFAEIIRAIFQWDGLGRITNGSNLLRKYTNFHVLSPGGWYDLPAGYDFPVPDCNTLHCHHRSASELVLWAVPLSPSEMMKWLPKPWVSTSLSTRCSPS